MCLKLFCICLYPTNVTNGKVFSDRIKLSTSLTLHPSCPCYSFQIVFIIAFRTPVTYIMYKYEKVNGKIHRYKLLTSDPLQLYDQLNAIMASRGTCFEIAAQLPSSFHLLWLTSNESVRNCYV